MNLSVNKRDSYIRFYTKLEIQNKFKQFIFFNKVLQRENEILCKAEDKYSNEYKQHLELKKKIENTIRFLFQELKYIVNHPDRIKIISIPIRPFLQERKNIEIKNEKNNIKIENLMTIFNDVIHKMNIREKMPIEYSTKNLDNEICKQKKRIKELESVILKLSKKKKKVGGLLDKLYSLLNCDDETETIINDEEIIEDTIQDNGKKKNSFNLTEFLVSLC